MVKEINRLELKNFIVDWFPDLQLSPMSMSMIDKQITDFINGGCEYIDIAHALYFAVEVRGDKNDNVLKYGIKHLVNTYLELGKRYFKDIEERDTKREEQAKALKDFKPDTIKVSPPVSRIKRKIISLEDISFNNEQQS